jgi:hypothetical protein
LPALTKLLDCKYDDSRATAAYLLAVLGTDASAVEPALLKFIRSKETSGNLQSAAVRKFGDSVMSKSDTAMTNEVLCKILCHNLTCLIQEQETLGISPVFWKDEAGSIEPEILPMRRLSNVSINT